MKKDEFREWRESCGLTQTDVAKRFGVSRNTIQNWEYGLSPTPSSLADLCKVWGDRLRKEIPELGPVTLCYADGPMFVDPYGPRRKLAMLKQEAFPTNAAAIARVRIIWGRSDVHGPFISEKSGEMLWNQVELSRVIDGSDEGAPTVRNTILKVATYVADNSTAFARGPKSVSAAETEERTRRIAEIGKELERLANESETRQIDYSEFEALLGKLHRLAFYPSNKQVHDVANAIMGEEIARGVA